MVLRDRRVCVLYDDGEHLRDGNIEAVPFLLCVLRKTVCDSHNDSISDGDCDSDSDDPKCRRCALV